MCVMKLRESAERLINDYWKSAKSEVSKGNSWNSLSEEQQNKLIIKYWGREKTRREEQLTELLNELENQGETYEKDIELAKFHEERGKVNCKCWHCSESKYLSSQAKQEQDQYWNEPEPKPTNSTYIERLC